MKTPLVCLLMLSPLRLEEEYCLSRDDQLNCKICVLSYLSNFSCKPPSEEIKDCLFYANEKECLRCKYGKFLANNNQKCEKMKKSLCLAMNQQKECIVCDKDIQIEKNQCHEEN